MSGYQALREHAALIELPGRALIRATGEDRARLVHAMCTNHVQELQPGQSCYAFFLTAQGRIIADAHIHCLDDALLLETEPALGPALFAHLDKFIIADDVTLADETEKLRAFSVEGPGSAAIAIPELPGPNANVAYRGGLIAGGGTTGSDGFRFFLPPAAAEQVRSQLDLPLATAEEANMVRLENARPVAPADITNQSLAHETQLMHAMHFTKGCYLGQEIVERVRSRGHVNRLLVQLEIASEKAPDAGTPVMLEGAEAGQITSAAYSPALGKVVALGYVRAAAVQAKSALQVGESEAVVTGKTPA